MFFKIEIHQLTSFRVAHIMESEGIASLAMRFECGELNYDLIIPVVIYSALLGYLCDQVEQCQSRVVDTGFIKNKPTD